jgi:hypothetical protein
MRILLTGSCILPTKACYYWHYLHWYRPFNIIFHDCRVESLLLDENLSACAVSQDARRDFLFEMSRKWWKWQYICVPSTKQPCFFCYLRNLSPLLYHCKFKTTPKVSLWSWAQNDSFGLVSTLSNFHEDDLAQWGYCGARASLAPHYVLPVSLSVWLSVC